MNISCCTRVGYFKPRAFLWAPARISPTWQKAYSELGLDAADHDICSIVLLLPVLQQIQHSGNNRTQTRDAGML